MRKRMVNFIFALFCVLGFSFPSAAQTSDDFFNGDILHEVRIFIAPRDYATLKQTNFICPAQDYEALSGKVISDFPRIECWFAVEFHWKFNGRDITIPQGAISSHGKGSRSNIKPSFKIEFSRYESQNTFLGLKNIVLRANTQDASMMHERVAMEFFRKLGIPAPRAVHTRLFINDQYAGVYTILEDIDSVFLQRNLGESDGRLYNYEWVSAWVFDYRGRDLSRYSPLPLKPENNLIYLDAAPIEAMTRTINEAPNAQFSAEVSQYIDLNALFRELAAENFVAEQDGIIGNYGLNNFFLYRFQNSIQSTFIPWDKSNAFWALDWNIMHNFTTNVLTSRALTIAPNLIAAYKDRLRQASDIAGGVGGWLEQEVTKEYQQIRQAVYDDNLKLCDPGATGSLRPCTNDQFDAEALYMIQFARQRAAIVRAQLAAGP
ncbi:MAG TPA: CotH kinase family protein [Terriglobia bacterium]|nr:CotH kinase family protein [Terriglobia bacterium]